MPVTTISTYHRPTGVAEAWDLVRDGGARVRLLAGGTDLVVRCPAEVRELVDLAAAGLGGVETLPDGTLRVGAMVTFTELLEHPEAAAHGTGVLGEMLAQVGSVLHRNSATMGGHLARARLSDVIPVLLALDAIVATYTGADRERPLADHLATADEPHLITGVLLPALPDRSAAAFERFSRASFDHALLNCCCRVDLEPDGTVGDVRVVVGEPSILGRRISVVEDVLRGEGLTPERITAAGAAARASVETRGDWIASAEYRSHLAGVAVERCLVTVSGRLPGGGA